MDAHGAKLKILAGVWQTIEPVAIYVIFTEVHFLESYDGAARFDQIIALLVCNGFQLHDFYGINDDPRGQTCSGYALFVHAHIAY